MTDEELIARLRLYGRSEVAVLEAAARIEALTAKVKLMDDLDAINGEKIEALEAKLAKAVEALRETTQMLSQCTFTIIRMKGQYFDRHEVIDKANAVLAELEGKE